MRRPLLPFSKINRLTFNERPVSIPAELRPLWKISCILLVLKLNCIREKASLSKLQLFNWGMGSPITMKNLFIYSTSKSREFLPDVVPLDPSINRAVAFAVADGLVELDNTGKIKLSDKGNTLVNWILDDPTIFQDEKEMLTMIGKSVTEDTISKAYQ
jgi:hypothetical protein